jgi:hypothetical protein
MPELILKTEALQQLRNTHELADDLAFARAVGVHVSTVRRVIAGDTKVGARFVAAVVARFGRDAGLALFDVHAGAAA